ncbi:hypothetical protein LY13_005072 [Prauserella aidingensis]|uniref:hypothetical protein n=1 Tax=Prauserella aidingensis TaxID=387890 RepID=UPI0020A48CDD|nr:hypothetical protein [Prauserella aidingensis]MCP2256282.1 hypothetical protein [Prauserella aidingensis]
MPELDTFCTEDGDLWVVGTHDPSEARQLAVEQLAREVAREDLARLDAEPARRWTTGPIEHPHGDAEYPLVNETVSGAAPALIWG